MQTNWRKYVSLREWPLAAFIVLAVVVGNALAVTYYISYTNIRESDGYVTYTQGNIARVLEFSTALQEAIVAQHGYLSLGRRDYQAIAEAKLKALPKKLEPVLERVKHDESQNALAEMRFETEALLKMSDTFMAARKRGDLARAYDPKMSESFFELARHIQANANTIRKTEQRLLDARTTKAEHRQTYYVSMMLVASLFSLTVVVVISWLMLKLRTRHEIVADELREARERFELAMKGMADGIYDWRPHSQDLYMSPRLKEMYGFKPHEMPNTLEAMKALIHPADFEEAYSEVERYLRREVPVYKTVYRVRHKDGHWMWIMSRGAAQWNSKGVPTRMVGIHTDVTSLKQMEEELRVAKSKADTANRAKTNFLANMSHEIRTPMNAIIGIAGILARKAEPKARDREYIDALNIASKSLFALINDLLDLSKLDDGSLLLEQMAFDPRQVLEDAIRVMRVRADEKKIGLSLEIAPNLPAQLIGDAHRLNQIITNLLTNAVKFTEQGGVTVKAGLTPVGHLEIRVKDTGIGIPPEACKTIFEKFTQSDPSITRRFGGTGLGLSISRELAELMGGEIDLTSKVGKGSEFVVTLPLPLPAADHATDRADKAVAMTETDERNLTRGRVLLVEDYKPNVLVARTVLLNLGFACDVATNGREALSAAASARHGDYVAVLMDVQLPDINGVDATIKIRSYEADHGLHRLPIIAMTAHALMGDREKFIAAGMDAYIAKPFDPDDLTEKLLTLARKPDADGVAAA